jgi:hypothetical protein
LDLYEGLSKSRNLYEIFSLFSLFVSFLLLAIFFLPVQEQICSRCRKN